MSSPSVSPYPRIGNYGFLSDCHTGALVAPDGGIEWLCLPRFDSPSVFAAVLDRGAGRYRLGPEGMATPTSRRYEPGTNIIETTWMTPTGWVVIHDALVIGEWRRRADDPHTRPPPDYDAERLLLRTAECIQGEVELSMLCEPAPGYGERRPHWAEEGPTATVLDLDDEGDQLRLSGDLHLGLEGTRALARHTLQEGEFAYTALTWGSDQSPPTSDDDARERIATTARFWRHWLHEGDFPDHPWRGYLQRSALVLKGLTYAPTGALVAALTTSLPETPGGERNWDYRYTWIRDATFTLWALHTLGFDVAAQDFVQFVTEVCRGASGAGLQIMYGIGGERELTERSLDLHGYEGARPVRTGNAAHSQRQNDVYGALLDSVYIHTKARDHLYDDLWELLEEQVDAAAEVWSKPDQGIWEARGEPKHYISSKLMCWVAMDRGTRLAERRDEPGLAERWGATADEIRADILGKGVSERGVFRQHYDTDALDASTLLIPLVRFLPPEDERVEATVLAIEDELTEDGLVLRYRVEETDDGLSGEEGTFTICSFWLVAALSEIGHAESARELCERLLSFAGDLKLYAEELDAKTGRHWGNFPQAFTHLALINALSHVISDDLAIEREGPHGLFSEIMARRS